VSIPSGPGGIFPVPNPWLQDNSYSQEVNDLARKIQENTEKQQIAIGANSNTVASVGLTGLYAGTWTGYTGHGGLHAVLREEGRDRGDGRRGHDQRGNFPARPDDAHDARWVPAREHRAVPVHRGGRRRHDPPTTGVVIVEVAATGV
jgi:hypothetical protein